MTPTTTPVKDALEVFTATMAALGYLEMELALPFVALNALNQELLTASRLELEPSPFDPRVFTIKAMGVNVILRGLS